MIFKAGLYTPKRQFKASLKGKSDIVFEKKSWTRKRREILTLITINFAPDVAPQIEKKEKPLPQKFFTIKKQYVCIFNEKKQQNEKKLLHAIREKSN